MKKILGFAFLALYLLIMIRPVSPMLEYWVRYDYIVAELCIERNLPQSDCKGKCHLSKQLKKANDTPAESPVSLPKINPEEIPIALINKVEIKVSPPRVTRKYSLDSQPQRKTPYLDGLFRPPQLMS